jgi:hypothetical protein
MTRSDVVENALHAAGKPSGLYVGIETYALVVHVERMEYSRYAGTSGAADGNSLYVIAEYSMLCDIHKRIDAMRRDNMDRFSEVDHGETSSGDIGEFFADLTQIGKVLSLGKFANVNQNFRGKLQKTE